MNEFDKAINTVIIPNIPKSSGMRRRASMMPTIKVTLRFAILSMKLQESPLIVFCFNDFAANFFLY